MDNFTHSISGIVLSRAGLGRLAPLGTATLLVSSNFPDVDMLIEAFGRLERDHVLSHRGVTHSLAAAPLEVLAITTFFWIVGRFVGKKQSAVSWWRLALLASVGLAVHLALDVSNEYGMRFLSPFNSGWYAWDLTSVLDFWVVMILALGWLLPIFLGLSRGDRDGGRLIRMTATLALLLVGAYLGVKQVSHSLALEYLEGLAVAGNPTRIACLPGAFSPLRWTGVVETERAFQIVEVGVPQGSLRTRHVFAKDCPAQVERAARESRQVQILLSWARFPIFHAKSWSDGKEPPGYTVLVEDVRWLSPKGYFFGPAAQVWMNGDLAIVREKGESWR
jgi:inner membrane protein